MANRSYGPPAATARKHQITHFSGASAGNLNDGKLFRNFRFCTTVNGHRLRHFIAIIVTVTQRHRVCVCGDASIFKQ